MKLSELAKRHIMCGLALALAYSGSPIISGFEYFELSQKGVLSVTIGLQFLFLLALYNLCPQKWVVLIIVIEVACMLYQIAVIRNWADPSDIFWRNFEYFMYAALSLEVLIIYASLWGDKIKASIFDGIHHLRIKFSSLVPVHRRMPCGSHNSGSTEAI